ncbi:MAG TPA: glycosyltransferase [Opitutus sp.]|nr:glycosyltransferase [Opitutus sp.]
MIHFDITKAGGARHRSGLTRLSERLRGELGAAATAGAWTDARRHAGAGDWFVTAEQFSEEERPGFGDFLRARRCRTAAIFADAIPLKFPQITWPQSVARHPHYMKLLAEFDRVWAISAASRDELLDYWRWLELTRVPPVEVLPLGADFDGTPRATRAPAATCHTLYDKGDCHIIYDNGARALLAVGIVEPRKNQTLLLDVCEGLWGEGRRFELHVVGRVNPHFGKPIAARMKGLRKKFAGLHFHEAAGDRELAALYAAARATVCPTIAEGCGLPLLESLWHGVPCVCSDLPVLRENAEGGGCVPVPVNDRTAWTAALRRVLADDAEHARLVREATTRALPTWAEAAKQLRRGLE